MSLHDHNGNGNAQQKSNPILYVLLRRVIVWQKREKKI